MSDGLAARLRAQCRPGEVVVPITPKRLHVPFWPAGRAWPSALAAGVIERSGGYQHRPENVCAAALLWDERATHVVELGAGSGSLLLAALTVLQPATATAIERQPEAADRLRRTLLAHELEADVRTGDLRDETTLRGLPSADLVIANPPFYPATWGRPSADAEVHASTHALHGSVADFLHTAAQLLRPGGCAWFVYDAGRTGELLAHAGTAGFGLDRLVWIPDARTGRHDVPTRVWVRLARTGGAALERLSD